MTYLGGAAWLAAPGFRDDLLTELSIVPDTKRYDQAMKNAALPPAEAMGGAVKRALKGMPAPGETAIVGDLVYREGPAPTAYWHQNALSRPFVAEFSSIREAADILRSVQRNWAHYPVAAFRRAELIRERRITSYNVCYTKLLRCQSHHPRPVSGVPGFPEQVPGQGQRHSWPHRTGADSQGRS